MKKTLSIILIFVIVGIIIFAIIVETFGVTLITFGITLIAVFIKKLMIRKNDQEKELTANELDIRLKQLLFSVVILASVIIEYFIVIICLHNNIHGGIIGIVIFITGLTIIIIDGVLLLELEPKGVHYRILITSFFALLVASGFILITVGWNISGKDIEMGISKINIVKEIKPSSNIIPSKLSRKPFSVEYVEVFDISNSGNGEWRKSEVYVYAENWESSEKIVMILTCEERDVVSSFGIILKLIPLLPCTILIRQLRVEL